MSMDEIRLFGERYYIKPNMTGGSRAEGRENSEGMDPDTFFCYVQEAFAAPEGDMKEKETRMGDYRDDDFWDKPSWRDRDRRKDRSGHVGQDDLGVGSKWVRKEILRGAEKLFQGGGKKKVDPEQEKARNEIHQAVGTKKFEPAVKRFLKQYGLPKDWGTLLLLLDGKDGDTAVSALESLKALYPDQGLEEQRGFRSKLNIISMTAKNEELKLCAEEVVIDL
jgi:hypothetical protein